MSKLYNISKDEFIFIPKNKVIKEDININDSESPAELKSKDILIGRTLQEEVSSFNIRRRPTSLTPIYKGTESFPTTYIKPVSSYPFDLKISNYIKIKKTKIEIDKTIIKIKDITAFRFKKPNGANLSIIGKKDMCYSFDLKLKNNEMVTFNCCTNDGNKFWFGENEHLYKDSFSDIWPILLNYLQKRIAYDVIVPIVNSLHSGNNFNFGSKTAISKFQNSYMSVKSEGVYLDIDTLFITKSILVPWNKLTYKYSNRYITIYHKYKITKHKRIYYSSWNTFLLPILIDYMSNPLNDHTLLYNSIYETYYDPMPLSYM